MPIESDFYYDYVTIITGKGQGAILSLILKSIYAMSTLWLWSFYSNDGI